MEQQQTTTAANTLTAQEKASRKAAQVRARMKRYYERHKEEIKLKRMVHYYNKTHGIDILNLEEAP